ncbi:TPA: hypothetical protein ACT9LI_002280 [Legionella pneumophila]
MLACNELDTGLNVTWSEKTPTSDWSFIAREFVEFVEVRKANDRVI